MLYEPNLEKLVHPCIDLSLDIWVLGVLSQLDWLLVLHFDLVLCHVRCPAMVLKSASSISRNFVVSFSLLVC